MCCYCTVIRRTHSLFRIHFDKLKNIPVLQLDSSVDFHSDPAVQEQLISKVFTTAVPPTICSTRNDHLIAPCVCSSLSQTTFLFFFFLGEEVLQFFINEDQQGETMVLVS